THTTPPDCDDGDVCTHDECMGPGPEDCSHVPETPLPPTCGQAICRSPGFWGTHAGTEKSRSVNVTEAVIDCADGNCANHTANDYLSICGEKIGSPDTSPADGTPDWNDVASSTEAICAPPGGASIHQLVRQLTAAALNCIISGGGASCSGTSPYKAIFADCNGKCAGGTATKEQMTACIGELDCLNNGGSFDNGICTPGTPGNNCHERLLVNESLDLNFEPTGPAGSSDACNAANGTKCTVVGPFEGPGVGKCAVDSLP